MRGFEASERRARRGSSLPRRLLPIALLPDSVQGAEQPDPARLQPPLAPPLLPQTEDAPWRLEACVSSSARESGICSGALETQSEISVSGLDLLPYLCLVMRLM